MTVVRQAGIDEIVGVRRRSEPAPGVTVPPDLEVATYDHGPRFLPGHVDLLIASWRGVAAVEDPVGTFRILVFRASTISWADGVPWHHGTPILENATMPLALVGDAYGFSGLQVPAVGPGRPALVFVV